MKLQPQALVVFFFAYLAIFFANGPLASAYAVTSLNASTSIVPIAARGFQHGPCPAVKPCKGDITHYNAGPGACGGTNNGDVDRVVVLPQTVLLVVLGPNLLPCGLTITIRCTATGKTTTPAVVDKCMGCKNYDIELSQAAFQDLENLAVSRTSATWWFNVD
jgi:hypothetical protein